MRDASSSYGAPFDCSGCHWPSSAFGASCSFAAVFGAYCSFGGFRVSFSEAARTVSDSEKVPPEEE